MYNQKAILVLLLLMMVVVMAFPSGAFAAQESEPVRYTPEQVSQMPPGTTLTPVYGTGTRQVDRKETIRNLPDNDVERLPQRKIYTDTDGRGPGTSVKGDLKLAEVKYKLAGRDAYGIPNNYTAYVVYRGEETYTALFYYETDGAQVESAGVTADSANRVDISAPLGEFAAGAVEPPIDTESWYDEYSFNSEVANAANPEAGEEFYDAEIDNGDLALSDPDTVAGADTDVDTSGFAARITDLLGSLSPMGTATLVTLVAAVLTLLILSSYNRRKVREAE